MERDRAALRKPGDDDASRRDAPVLLASDQRLDLPLRLAHAREVGARSEIGGQDVVPRAHPHAVVDRHRAHRRVREHEAQREPRRQRQLLDDGNEVVAVGAEPVQPDHRRVGGRTGFEFDGRQQGGGFGHRWACATGRARRRKRRLPALGDSSSAARLRTAHFRLRCRCGRMRPFAAGRRPSASARRSGGPSVAQDHAPQGADRRARHRGAARRPRRARLPAGRSRRIRGAHRRRLRRHGDAARPARLVAALADRARRDVLALLRRDDAAAARRRRHRLRQRHQRRARGPSLREGRGRGPVHRGPGVPQALRAHGRQGRDRRRRLARRRSRPRSTRARTPTSSSWRAPTRSPSTASTTRSSARSSPARPVPT